ncbi:MAG TPA: DUF6599 family protein [Thermoanaerobaculia bacterium]|nr:DUF6599 family protein [Thermoanaerobaculia bacterium]
MQFLPRLDEVPGWSLEDDPLVVPAEHLETQIGADAAHFREYEAMDATIGTYGSTSGQGFARVEIFRFPDFVKAFGAYSTRRTANSQPLDIQNEGFIGPRSVHIWRGPFYVRVIGGGDAQAQETLPTLATAVASGMQPAPGKPAVFDFLPVTTRVVNSESFAAEGGFGQPFFANSFTARFTVNNQPIDGLILPAPSRSAAATLLNRYRQFFIANGRVLDPIPNLGEDNFTAEDRFFGRTVAFRLDRFVIAFRGFGDRQALIDQAITTDQRILATIRTQLQRAEQQAREALRRPTGTPRPAQPAWAEPEE